MIQYHIYPDEKRRIVTFSYDDGSSNDTRLVELFNRYNVKATFHINAKKYISMSKEEREIQRELYRGHEVSCHTLSHGWPTRMPPQSLVYEVMKDRELLEDVFGYPVLGMSYPSGSYNTDVEAVLRACGIVYSRTVDSTNKFILPNNFLEWHPSCHHNGAISLIDKFIENLDSQWHHPLFYIWGHSHELRSEENWKYIEDVISKLANNEKIWYATIMDIYNYMKAQSMLQISADEKIFYNPTATDVWVEKDKVQIIKIPAGKTVRLQ